MVIMAGNLSFIITYNKSTNCIAKKKLPGTLLYLLLPCFSYNCIIFSSYYIKHTHWDTLIVMLVFVLKFKFALFSYRYFILIKKKKKYLNITLVKFSYVPNTNHVLTWGK